MTLAALMRSPTGNRPRILHRRRCEHCILRRVQDLGVQSERSVEAAQVRCLVEEDAADRNLLAEIDHDPIIVVCCRVEVPASRTRTTGRGGGAADVPVDQSRASVEADVAGRHRLPRRHVAMHVPGRVDDHLVEVKIVVDDEFNVSTDGSGRLPVAASAWRRGVMLARFSPP